eukprot:9489027-Pyramimonas_sp.AAC.2
MSLCETHTLPAAVVGWKKKAQQCSLKLLGNPARPKAKLNQHSCEGGKFFYAKNHLPVQVLDAA